MSNSSCLEIVEVFPGKDVALRISQLEFFQQRLVCTFENEVKDVVAAFIWRNFADTRLLKEVIFDSGSVNLVLKLVEVHEHVLAKTGRIVISNGLSISEAFQDWITAQNSVANVSQAIILVSFAAHGSKLSQELHRNLGRLCFASSRLSRDNNSLSATIHH